MAVPQRLTFVTLGARDLGRMRSFYESLGWERTDLGADDFAVFSTGTTNLALFPLERLGEEAAPGEALPAEAGWNGVALACNVESRADVDPAFRAFVDAGGRAVAEPTEREWGGYTGYVADPEGNRWEIAWAPGIPLE